MHTSKCRNSKEAGWLLIKRVDYVSVISLITLINVHPFAGECTMKVLLRLILNGKQDQTSSIINEIRFSYACMLNMK